MKYLLLLVFSFVIVSCGYQSFEECYMKELQKFEDQKGWAVSSVRNYCNSLDYGD